MIAGMILASLILTDIESLLDCRLSMEINMPENDKVLLKVNCSKG